MLSINMNLSLQLNQKQYIDVLFKPIFLGMCILSEGFQGILVYTFMDQDLEAKMSGDDEIDCIKDENFLTQSG